MAAQLEPDSSLASPVDDPLILSSSPPKRSDTRTSRDVDHFEHYMAEVKRTPMLDAEALIQAARLAYVHHFEILRVLSAFPLCPMALVEQYRCHEAARHKISNFVAGYADQSPQARDELLELNRTLGQGNAEDELSEEADLARCLESLSAYVARFEAAEDADRRATESLLRQRMAECYRCFVLRYEEFHRHCTIFEDATTKVSELAEQVCEIVGPENRDRLLGSFTLERFEAVVSVLPENRQGEFRRKAKAARETLDRAGVSVFEVLRLRVTYTHHKALFRARVNAVVQANLLLAAREANRARVDPSRKSDACQEANIGLVTAAERFQYWRGFAFSTYACWWIRQRLERYRNETRKGAYAIPVSMVNRATAIGKLRREHGEDRGRAPLTPTELAAELNCDRALVDRTIQAYSPDLDVEALYDVADAEDVTPEAQASQADLEKVVELALATIPPRKRAVCRRRWGIGCHQEKLAEVAKEFGMTKVRVQKIEAEGMRLLREGPYGEQLQEMFELL